MLIGFFHLHHKNRLGADKCVGMYAREEDIFHAVYWQIKGYVKAHFISDLQYKQRMQEFNKQIVGLSRQKMKAWIRAMEHYKRFIKDEISKEDFQVVQNAVDNALMALSTATKCRDPYEKQYATFQKLLSVSNKDILLSEIVDYIDKIVVDSDKQIIVKFNLKQSSE